MSDRDMKLLITGATGFVGGNLTCRLLGLGYSVVLLVRNNNGDPKQRIRKILMDYFNEDEIDELLESRITLLVGDVSQKRLGLDGFEYNNLLENVSGVWHCAASLKFDEQNRENIELQNIAGTENILDLIESSDRATLHHISTAYVAGNRRGVVAENDLSSEFGFKNPYEESKFKAEKSIEKRVRVGRVRAVVYRPSIIVGDSITLRISGITGIYAVSRVLDSIIEKYALRRFADEMELSSRSRIRIPGAPDANLNLVPIDYVIDSMLSIFRFANNESGIFHIVNQKPPSLGTVCDGISDALGIRLKPAGSESFEAEPPTIQEKLLIRNIRVYLPYLSDCMIFDDSNARNVIEQVSESKNTNTCPSIDRESISRFIGYCRANDWRMT